MKATNLQLGLFTAQVQLFEYNNWITFSESTKYQMTRYDVTDFNFLSQAQHSPTNV